MYYFHKVLYRYLKKIYYYTSFEEIEGKYLTWLEISVPIGLFIISFLLKLVVGKDPKVPEFIQHLIELPCDIAFIALSFLSAAIIFSAYFDTKNYFILLCIFVVIVLTLLIRSKSIKYFDKKKNRQVFLLTLLNYLLSISTIYGIIYYLLHNTKG